jgi:hypothetical protein
VSGYPHDCEHIHARFTDAGEHGVPERMYHEVCRQLLSMWFVFMPSGIGAGPWPLQYKYSDAGTSEKDVTAAAALRTGVDGQAQLTEAPHRGGWMFRTDSIKPARVSIAIYIAAAVVRLTIAFGFHSTAFDTRHRPEPLNIARSLAATGSFANPFPTPTGYTAHIAPLYPALVAGIYAIWGDTPRAEAVRIGTSIAAAAALYAVLPYVSSALGIGLWPGILAGAGGALFPLHHHYEVEGAFETTWLALFLELSTLLFARFIAAQSWTLRSALVGGAWWAFGCLLSPNVLPVLLGFLALGLWKLRPAVPLAGSRLAVFAVAFFAVISPWMIRNYIRLGGLFFVRDNFGLELFIANHDGASPVLRDNIFSPLWPKIHPFSGPEVARELARTGELAFYRLRERQALAWIRTHPSEFCSLTLRRICTFWFAPFEPGWRRALLWTLTVAAFLGLLPLSLENGFAALVLASILVTYSAVYAVISSWWRYQHPVYWVLLLLDGYLTWLVLRRLVPAFRVSES